MLQGSHEGTTSVKAFLTAENAKAAETQRPQRHSGRKDTAAAETQRQQRHSGRRDTAGAEKT